MFSLPARGDAKLSDRSIRKENAPNAVKLNPRMVESFLQLKVGTKTKPLVGWLVGLARTQTSTSTLNRVHTTVIPEWAGVFPSKSATKPQKEGAQ